jgi:hypothetical protein
MAASRWDGSAWTPIGIARRWDGSAWVDITRGRRWDGSAWVDFLPRVAISNRTLSDANTDGFISYELLASGVAQRVSGSLGTLTFSGEWRVRGASADYEVRATLNSGSLNSGTTGTWLSLSTSRGWSRDFDGDADLTIEIRDAASLAVLSTANVTLNVGGI